jgi:uncharacterized membrane protein YdjX (TVP38/TMEM64 family)
MRRAVGAAAAISAVLLAIYAIVIWLDIPVLSDESADLGSPGLPAALLSVTLLAVDVVLPIPSSAVMIANGAVFGAVLGTVLSVIGSVASAVLGVGIGRRGAPVLLGSAPASRPAQAAKALHRHGIAAVALTRPVPILAETVALMAGAMGMAPRDVALAAGVGALPAAVVYAAAGAYAAFSGFAGLLVVGTILAALALWMAGRLSTSPKR